MRAIASSAPRTPCQNRPEPTGTRHACLHSTRTRLCFPPAAQCLAHCRHCLRYWPGAVCDRMVGGARPVVLQSGARCARKAVERTGSLARATGRRRWRQRHAIGRHGNGACRSPASGRNRTTSRTPARTCRRGHDVACDSRYRCPGRIRARGARPRRTTGPGQRTDPAATLSGRRVAQGRKWNGTGTGGSRYRRYACRRCPGTAQRLARPGPRGDGSGAQVAFPARATQRPGHSGKPGDPHRFQGRRIGVETERPGPAPGAFTVP